MPEPGPLGISVTDWHRLINVLLFEGRWEKLNADVELGVFSWASSSATIAAAFAAAVRRSSHERASDFGHWSLS